MTSAAGRRADRMRCASGTAGAQRQPASAEALERALARHLAVRGPVRDEDTMRAIVAAALRRAIRAPRHDASRPAAPTAGSGDDPVAAALRLGGEPPVRAGTAQMVRLYFQALADTGRRDETILVEELVDAFVAGVWRGLSAPSAPLAH